MAFRISDFGAAPAFFLSLNCFSSSIPSLTEGTVSTLRIPCSVTIKIRTPFPAGIFFPVGSKIKGGTFLLGSPSI
jgi:hypothetical protein